MRRDINSSRSVASEVWACRKIVVGDMVSVLARAAAREFVLFWQSPAGHSVRAYLYQEAGQEDSDAEQFVDERLWLPLTEDRVP